MKPGIIVMVELFAAAEEAGVDVLRWFFHGDFRGADTLSLGVFEKSVQGLVLAVCAANPGNSRLDSVMERVVAGGFVLDVTEGFRREGCVEVKRLLTRCRSLQWKRRKRKGGMDEVGVKEMLERHVLLRGTEALFRAVGFWKWSKDGRYPCGKAGSGSAETICLAAFRRALQHVGIPSSGRSLSLRSVRRFSRFLSKSLDSPTERRVKMQESGGKVSDCVNVNSLRRWVNSVRLSGCKDYQRWADEKAQLESSRRERLIQELDMALAGDLQALERLMQRVSALKRMIQLADFSKHLPEWAVESEAEAAVDTWMKTSGQRMSHGSGRKEVYERKLDVAKETLRTSVTAKVDLIQRYYKDLSE